MAQPRLLSRIAHSALTLQVADGACCTSGQPTYVNNRLNFIGLPTCSDGPCKDEAAGYDYTRLTGKESDDPTSCCGLGGTFVYNPPADSTSTYPGPGYPMYPQINGTGRGCNATIAKWFCGITGQVSSRAGSTLAKCPGILYPCKQKHLSPDTHQQRAFFVTIKQARAVQAAPARVDTSYNIWSGTGSKVPQSHSRLSRHSA